MRKRICAVTLAKGVPGPGFRRDDSQPLLPGPAASYAGLVLNASNAANGSGFGEQIALRMVAAQGLEQVALGRGFHLRLWSVYPACAPW